LNRAWPGIMVERIIVVFVEYIVVSVAEVLGATLAELCSTLSAASFPFHSFLASDSKAPYVSHFDLFTCLEIGGQIRCCD
jgi:hypothetical protein